MAGGDSPPRKPLHERSDSLTNTRTLAAVRLVPPTPPQLLGDRDDVFSRTPLPTHPSHVLLPGKGKARDDAYALQSEFQRPSKAPESIGFSGPTITHQSPQYDLAARSPLSRPKHVPKKRLQIHKDSKTFSLVPQDEPQAVEFPTSRSPTLSTRSSYSLLTSNAHDTGVRSSSIKSCISEGSWSLAVPATPEPEYKQSISADHTTINDLSASYRLKGGLRKVPKTPDLKQKASVKVDSPVPDISESDLPDEPASSHDLSTKPSFQSQSTETATTTSENTNYKVYLPKTPINSDTALVSPSSGHTNPNYRLLEGPSPASSVIRRPQTESESESENWAILGASSPSASYLDPRPQEKYSQESLVVPPLRPRTQRSTESLGVSWGYYKSRSRESLRSGSLTSISTVLTQRDAARAIVGSGALIQLPILASTLKRATSWARPLSSHPLHHPMIEIVRLLLYQIIIHPQTLNQIKVLIWLQPHQWSSQLSTVPSVSEGGTDRGSRTWSDDNGRRSSVLQSSQSHHSQHMLNISSSVAAEEATPRLKTYPFEPPQPTYARNGQIQSSSSSQVIGDQDEYGDGITDMQNLRSFPSRIRLSGLYSGSDSRTNTMRSTSSSRANSLLASSIPTWARLYYGSGEWRLWGAAPPGSSTKESDSRASSFRSGSPNTDHFHSTIYSPRRRPRQIRAHDDPPNRESLDIIPAPQHGSVGRHVQDACSKLIRTWSMSSIWSPHLGPDRRATRHSTWDPPSVNWSTEGGWFGRRNVQVVMFIVGWIFPPGKPHLSCCCDRLTDSIAWMSAALLPLPRKPLKEMREHDGTIIDIPPGPSDYTRQFGPLDEARYESAKWWRNLNRWMSLVGVIIIVAIVSSPSHDRRRALMRFRSFSSSLA